MLDLSNNNGVGHDFSKAYKAGQRRLYVKISEGVVFTDHTASTLAHEAWSEGFKVGGYHFARPDRDTNPVVEADFFLSKLHDALGPLTHKKHLRPVLDLEVGHADVVMGRWATKFMAEVRSHVGFIPVIYSYGSFLEACKFGSAPGPLWLANYGRNDGKEHPYVIPAPWRAVAAHQFASTAKVAGINGPVDISKVNTFRLIDVPLMRGV